MGPYGQLIKCELLLVRCKMYKVGVKSIHYCSTNIRACHNSTIAFFKQQGIVALSPASKEAEGND